ncbi:MAG: type II and III secretion system protein family protein [Lamprobacter sp.]|uniref:type II and III secretion system protein family protein n=1 Tax=Lamprobacter sp. TaxID=3100796 RepID=UPI002B259E99|nr:type II and III secretion system protein family protein [Lamprobacter sp.]MEA3640841.1 type II and III secretion system protein family protein [Lamprobacter sp.]
MNKPTWFSCKPWAKRLILVAVALCLGLQAQANGLRGSVRPRPQLDQGTIAVPINKSRVLELPVPAARISLGNPAIADILSINERQIYINGKQLGTTNMILWGENDQVQRQIGLEVTHDLQTLKEKFHQLMPKEQIRVSSANSAIVLSGEVSSPSRLDAAVRLAESFARDIGEVYGGLGPLSGADDDSKVVRVINLLRVGGAQQVLLEVKVAEVSRTFIKQMGINLLGRYGDDNISFTLMNDVGFAEITAADAGFLYGIPGIVDVLVPEVKLPVTGSLLDILGGNFAGSELALDIAQSQGLARILAEPNLTTLSGQKAEFLSGGEFPVPVADDDGNVEIMFKPFGINLNFLPFVLDNDLISLKVNVSVSELSDEAAVTVGASNVSAVTAIPSLRKRGADSTVEVPSGQTIAIAGLLSERTNSGGDRYPGLGDIPVLGNLFRSQQFEKRQTELVIFVTPRLARSYNPDLVKLPTEDFVDPSQVEFYLQGRLYGTPSGDRPASAAGQSKSRLGPDKSGSEGPFGHDL